MTEEEDLCWESGIVPSAAYRGYKAGCTGVWLIPAVPFPGPLKRRSNIQIALAQPSAGEAEPKPLTVLVRLRSEIGRTCPSY